MEINSIGLEGRGPRLHPLTTIDYDRSRRHVLQTIDISGFNWRIVLVASSSLFASSYNLFATIVVLPALQSIYWPNNGSEFFNLNIITLSGLILGQLLFGYLFDRYGRRGEYGFDLVMVIFSTIGIAQSSDGHDQSMSIIAWISVWRFVMGMGIGAGFPFSAVIAAEWAPVSTRSRSMAVVYLMQPIGQLIAFVVGLIVALGYSNSAVPNQAVDQVWRLVIGLGGLPALVALYFRYTIPESPRYSLDVRRQAKYAVRDADLYFPAHDVLTQAVLEMGDIQAEDTVQDTDSYFTPENVLPNAFIETERYQSSSQADNENERNESRSHSDIEDSSNPKQFSIVDLKQYFVVEGNLRYLAATTLTWFFADLALYGLGTNNPNTLAKLWNSSLDGNETIFNLLVDEGKRFLLTISIASIVGSLLLIQLITHMPRKKLLIWSFCSTAVLLATTGGFILRAGSLTEGAVVVTVLYALCSLLFNFGINPLTFIIPAEIFPTRYRATCHGISAAAGSLGAVIAQVSLYGSSSTEDPNFNRLGWLLIGCSISMLFAALFSWAWIPTIVAPRLKEGSSRSQRREVISLESKTLEELGRGIKGAQIDGDIIGMRKSIRRLLRL